MENNTIKAVFFDLGKVLLRFRHEEIVSRLLSAADDADDKADGLFDFLFDSRSGLCNLYDEGNISSEDFYAEIDRRFGLGVDYSGFVPLWNEIFSLDSDVADLMRRVRGTRPVYLLSNVNELHWEHVAERYPALSEMDGWVLSCRVKAKKPSPVIYDAAKAAAGVGPGESVFIDDLPENAAAADSAGIKGIVFTGADTLERELRLLGLI